MTKHPERIDPDWPHYDQGEDHAVSELTSETQGAQMPFGDIDLPADLERDGHSWRPKLNSEVDE